MRSALSLLSVGRDDHLLVSYQRTGDANRVIKRCFDPLGHAAAINVYDVLEKFRRFCQK